MLICILKYFSGGVQEGVWEGAGGRRGVAGGLGWAGRGYTTQIANVGFEKTKLGCIKNNPFMNFSICYCNIGCCMVWYYGMVWYGMV